MVDSCLQLRDLWDIVLPQASWLHAQRRLEICSGTRAVTDAVDGREYRSGARVPLDDWRPLDPEAVELLTGNAAHPTPPMHCVCLVDLPVPVSDPLRALLRDKSEPLREEFAELVASSFATDTPPVWLGYTWNHGGRRTVARNDELGHVNGLHVDSWDHEAIELRSSSRNRICFNVGLQTRYLLFVPISIMAIGMWLKLHDPEVVRDMDCLTDWGLRFMEANPLVPVLRLAIEPGEGYIAPTENTIHDGASTDRPGHAPENVWLDETVTMRGHFRSLHLQ